MPDNILTPVGNLRGQLTSGGLIPGVPVIIGEASGKSIYISDAANSILKKGIFDMPYSLDGYTGMKIVRTGKNIWENEFFNTESYPLTLITDPDSVGYGYYNGSISRWYSNNPVESYGNIGYRVNWGQVNISFDCTSLSGNFVFRARFMYDDGTINSSINYTASEGIPLHVSTKSLDNKNCIAFAIGTTAGVNNYNGCIKNVQVELGDTESTYNAPEGHTEYNVSWLDEVGSIDEGILTINNGQVILEADSQEYELMQKYIMLNKGSNTIWNDAGDIALEYTVDVQMLLQWLYDNIYNQ